MARGHTSLATFLHDGDANKNGELDKQEWRDLVKACGAETASYDLEIVEALFDELDVEGRGVLQHEELRRKLRIGLTSQASTAAGDEASAKAKRKGTNPATYGRTSSSTSFSLSPKRVSPRRPVAAAQ